MIHFKKIKHSQGFTLFETLIGINIAMVVIALILSLVMFMQKVNVHLIEKNEKQLSEFFLQKHLTEITNSSGFLRLYFEDNYLYLANEKRDTIYIYRDSLTINGSRWRFPYESFQLSFVDSDTGELTVYSSESEESIPMLKGFKNFCNVSSIYFDIEAEERKHRFTFALSPLPIKKFENY